MKTRYYVVLPTLIAGVALLTAGRLTAQTFTVLHSFSGGDSPTGLILSGNTLYGTTTGTVFAVNTDGSGFTNLHSFTDGASLSIGIIFSGNTLYGTTYGGSSSNGAVFKVNTDGTGFTNLHNFTASAPFTNSDGYVVYINNDGARPGGLILSNNSLYGTASGGGVWGSGTVFALNTDGTGFTNLHQFTSLTAYQISTDVIFSNYDGAYPGGLILSGNTLYVTTHAGAGYASGALSAVPTDGTGFTNLYYFPRSYYGSSPIEVILSGNTLYGTAQNYCCATGPSTYSVFAVNTDGSGSTILHYFAGLNGGTNSDGAYPQGLLVSSNALYGTTAFGGIWGEGTVFAVRTNGANFTILHSFSYYDSGGAYPYAGLILSGSILYGTATKSLSGYGTVFAVHTDGTAFTTLHSFPLGSIDSSSGVYTNSDGISPGGLILSGNTLYGTASQGGSAGNGTVFSISFRPQLTITPSGTNVILSWPVSVAGFSSAGYMLQDTANLSSPAGWSAPDPFPLVIVNGQYQVMRPMLGPQRSYRLTK